MFQIVKPTNARKKRTGITVSKPKKKAPNQRMLYISQDLVQATGLNKEARALVEFDPEHKMFRITKNDGEFTKKVVMPEGETSARIALTFPEDIGKMLQNRTMQYVGQVKDGGLYFSV